FFLTRRPLRSSLFPYTTLFRSLIAGVLADGIGWRAALLVLGLAIAAAALVVVLLLPKPQNSAPSRLALRELARLITVQFTDRGRSEEHTSELQSRENLVCRLLL